MGNTIPAELLNTITTGDARLLAERIPDESIDLIFTDPVYDRIEDYRWLAETAARVLKPSGVLLSFIGIGFLPQTIQELSRYLNYRWQFGVFQPNGPSRLGAYRTFSKWYACLWYDVEGNSKPFEFFPDMAVSVAFQNWFGTHKWRKNQVVFKTWLRAFTMADMVVFDPFTGGGTVPAVCKMLGRQYVAFEIDPTTADNARQRVANTQPPLPFEIPQQGAFNYD